MLVASNQWEIPHSKPTGQGKGGHSDRFRVRVRVRVGVRVRVRVRVRLDMLTTVSSKFDRVRIMKL